MSNIDPRLGSGPPPPPAHQPQHGLPPAQHAIPPHHSAGIPPPGSGVPPPHYAPVPVGKPPQFTAGGSNIGGGRTDSLRADAGAGAIYQQSPPQPYYHYPSPSTNQQTPQHVTASQHASPEQQIQQHYAPPPPPQMGALDHAHPSPGDPSPFNTGLADDGTGGTGNPDDPKRPRACEACRGLKVRCDQDPAHPEIPCKRCAKAGRECVITQPTRKRQKKADSRVAELEKKLDALTAALHQSQGGAGGYAGGSGAPQADMTGGMNVGGGFPQQYMQADEQEGLGALDPEMRGQKRRRLDNGEGDGQQQAYEPNLAAKDASLAKGFSAIEQAWAPNHDLRGLLTQSPEEWLRRINSIIEPTTAAAMFERYCQNLAPHLPAVVFPAGTSAEDVCREKPILYVCILSASSFGLLPHDTSKHLAREAVGAIADCVVRNGAKSLELIQAMQVLALYYKPPEQAEQTNFYQIIHMAAVMALDIGLGKRFNASKARRGFGGPFGNSAPGTQKTPPLDSDTLEARRAWLTCYYLCASASMVLRRPNLVRWTNYMKECLEVLESSAEAAPSDRLFCQHVKIQHICEEIGLQFLMDDNTANISITDPKVTYALNVLEAQLRNWKENVPDDCRGKGLEFFEHVTSLYLHEIALHFNHNIEDFRLPFTEESLKSVTTTNGGETLTQNQMAAIEACLRAAHGILNTMLSYEVDVVRGLPMLLYFVRCVYAIVILIKMHVAVTTPGSELGKMMKPEDLRVEHYVGSLIELFRQVTGDGEVVGGRQPKILMILRILKEWFDKHKEALSGGNGGPQVKSEGAGAHQDGQADSQHAQGPAQHQRQETRAYGSQQEQQQTPLHLLSQVATGNQQQQQPQTQQQPHGGTEGGVHTDWTFNSPFVVDYSKHPPPSHPDSRFPAHNASNQPSNGPPLDPSFGNSSDHPQQQHPHWQTPNLPSGATSAGISSSNMIDPTTSTNDFGWGSGFEQAMDIALGGMDGLVGGGLDGWFLGESMAPFGFQPQFQQMGGDGGGAGQGQGGW